MQKAPLGMLGVGLALVLLLSIVAYRNLQDLRASTDPKHHFAITSLALLAAGAGGAVVLTFGSWWLWGRRATGSKEYLSAVPNPEPSDELKAAYSRLEESVRERELAEARLHETESRARAFLDNTVDGIITIDGAGIVQSFNSGAERMFGWTAAEIVGRNISMLMPSPYREEHDGYIQRYLQTREKRIIGIGREVMARRKNGTEFPIDLTVSDVDGGERTRFTGIIRDISDRKRADEQLVEQASLLEKIREAVIVRDMSDRIVFWNHGAEVLYGWTAAEVVGCFANQLLFSAYPPELREAQQAVNQSGEWSGKLPQKTKAGREIVVESHWTLLRDDQGQPKGKVIINIDVTEKLRLESQLLRAQRLESIGTLAGGIAHDLNNLFTPIMLMINLLKRELNNPEQLHLLQTAQASVERGSDMIRQLLSFAGGIEGERAPVSAKDLVHELRAILEHVLPKSIETRFTIADDLWTMTGDATQLSQVLMNLCINARDAMPNGGQLAIVITNRLVNGDAGKRQVDAHPGRYVQLAVTDTGAGIPKKIMDKIFDPFFTTKELGKGTGLGLSTAMGIVKGHGGFLNVYSEEGRGTTVVVCIPATQETSAAAVVPAEPDRSLGQGKTILVVDDEQFLLEMIRSTLESFGYQVISTNDGKDALGEFERKRERISAVLVDMMMPGMDGGAVIRELRKSNPTLPIVACSGLHARGRENEAIQAGANAFLSKPFSDEQLVETLQKVLP